MANFNENVKDAISESFWIFFTTSLITTAALAALMSRDSLTQTLDLGNIVVKLLQMAFCSSAAWKIWNTTRRNYVLLCFITGLGYCMLVYFWEVFLRMALGGHFIGINMFAGGLITMIAGGILMGGILLVLSYPIQLLWSGLRFKLQGE